MSLDASRVAILDELVRQASIPIDGISVGDLSTTPPTVTIQYKPEATAEQMSLGEQIKANFDWRRRRALSRAAVVTAMNQLTAGQRAIIDRAQVADFLRNNPRIAAVISAETGIPLVVDEVDPT